MLLTQDEGVKSFLTNLTAQLSGKDFFLILLDYVHSLFSNHEIYPSNISCKEWLEAGKLQRIVLVIMSKKSNEVLERWNFSIETDNEVVEKG